MLFMNRKSTICLIFVMQKVDKKEAEKVLLKANESPVYQDDAIGISIDSILRGSHKTYRYVLITALLAKSTNKDVDILSLQAKDNSDGAYDARSLCHKVIVPFERNTYPNSIGGSNEPFLNKPARFQRLAMTNAVRSGGDAEILENMIKTLSEIKTKEQAQKYLSSAMYTLQNIYSEVKEKYSIPNLDIKGETNPQSILNYVNTLVKNSFEGEMCPLVVAAIEYLYYKGAKTIVPHKVNESGASSKEVGDIDIFDNAQQLMSSIEIKDKDFTKEDVEHAITKFAQAQIEKSLFIFGKHVNFEQHEVYETAALLGKKGYFCSVVSIMDFVRMRLYSMNDDITINQLAHLLLKYARQINAKDSTIEWIKSCTTEFRL